jgi:type IV pilus assembly protein PilC
MPAFTWKGKTRDGKMVSGERVADSRAAIETALRREQVTVTSVKEKGRDVALPKVGGKVPAKALSVFTRQFSVMIDAGLPLVQCLEILGSQQDHKGFARVLQQTRMDVEAGASLADAMRKHPKTFDDLFTNMIAAGEAGGILDTILKRLATYIEKAVKLKAQIKGAMVYPVAVFTIAGGVLALLLIKVVPMFQSMFESMDAELPLPTRIVIFSSHWLARGFLPLIVLVIVGAFAFRKYYSTYSGRRVVDRTMLRLPVLGDVLRKAAVARFCRTLGTLITSGVPILDGLDITARTSGNAIIEDAIMSTRKAVETGMTVAQPLKETNVFPPMVVQMISVGEQTGALDAMLSKIADFYEEEVEQAIANMLTLMEPLIIVMLGSTIGGVVISMYLPMFALVSKMSGH